MGALKNAEIEQTGDSASRWSTKCRIEGWNCMRCAELPLFDERELFFETGKGLCAYCYNVGIKDD